MYFAPIAKRHASVMPAHAHGTHAVVGVWLCELATAFALAGSVGAGTLRVSAAAQAFFLLPQYRHSASARPAEKLKLTSIHRLLRSASARPAEKQRNYSSFLKKISMFHQEKLSRRQKLPGVTGRQDRHVSKKWTAVFSVKMTVLFSPPGIAG
ncbi:hypothetical protein [uncultured Desulfovibrio sp.]|uniref:hypothetical protein n=1 Tax=uncultured Desulfovibrio sp. TaxID=167968 RepID=UPI00262B2874|nr:hypothetical protein [uncultured Desulfovibrio sp.]